MIRPWISIALSLASVPASAETIYYNYDALGRLSETFSTRSNYRTDYSLDTADNRASVYTRNIVFNLQAGQGIYSPDGRFELVMQGDSNFVLYGPSGYLWASGTYGSGASFAAMQGDGNLVVYTPGGQPVWASNTGGHPGSYLALQNDGNLVIYDGSNAAIWNTGTGGH